MRTKKSRLNYNKRQKRIEKHHNDLVRRIDEDPLILNESDTLCFKRENILVKIPEPKIGIYTSDLGILYRESSGRNIFLFLDVKTSLGRSINYWDARVKLSYNKKNIKKFKTRYLPGIKDVVVDFVAVLKDLWKFEVYHPQIFRVPNAEYYRKK